jgi:hypothetical protein
MPRRNRNATRRAWQSPRGRKLTCKRCRVRLADPYPEPGLEGLCGECADLAVWGAWDEQLPKQAA